jgi:hypothetical protein
MKQSSQGVTLQCGDCEDDRSHGYDPKHRHNRGNVSFPNATNPLLTSSSNSTFALCLYCAVPPKMFIDPI